MSKTNTSWNTPAGGGRRWAWLVPFIGWLLVLPGLAADELGISVKLYGNANTPTFDVINRSQVELDTLTINVGHLLKHFDLTWTGAEITPPPGGTLTRTTNGRTRDVTFDVSSWGPGEKLTFQLDIDDGDGTTVLNTLEDYRTVFFNNGSGGTENATITVVEIDSSRELVSTMLDQPNSTSDAYELRFGTPRQLYVTSLTEAATVSNYVTKVRVKINGDYWHFENNAPVEIGPRTNINSQITVLDGDVVEIIAPREVYRDINGVDITDSVNDQNPNDLAAAQQRLTASGILVNEQNQTGDPTLYQFTIDGDKEVVVQWQHDVALTINSDFSETFVLDGTNIWAGPLASDAAGNPEPQVGKNWIRKNLSRHANIDRSILDFSYPGLSIRYITTGYTIGPPGGVIETNHFVVQEIPSVGNQTAEFSMSGPLEITYKWKIQLGVQVNVDIVGRASLPRIFEISATDTNTAATNEGTYWFDPGSHLRIAAPSVDPLSSENLGLSGWINGDGYYFSSSGALFTDTGELERGGPRSDANASWASGFEFVEGDMTNTYRYLSIPSLRRPARVLWTYGNQQLRVAVPVGQYVFENRPDIEHLFSQEPESITEPVVTWENKLVGAGEMAIWDPAAAKLFPVVAGEFKATWKTNDTDVVDVIVTVVEPVATYSHIANTPGVALDPDPTDDFIFQGVVYAENDAIVDAENRFQASTRGKSVLRFSEIATGSRGAPEEYVAIRVVDTKLYDEGLDTTGLAVIGTKITDPALDLAELGTGYLMFQGGRFNPFIYDASSLEGLAANEIYDMAELLSNERNKVVVQPENLPGPIIPVNLHPTATATDKVTVVWYDDPTENDNLLWPHAVRVYQPRWPTEADGLGRIVIASQYGSESQVLGTGNTLLDQEVVGASADGTAEADTTFNPSRLQQVIIYNQPDPVQTGYNPNEEHGVIAPSLRFFSASPRPPAVYALRDNDLNTTTLDDTYTSDPYVLVQFFDAADEEFKMKVYEVVKEDPAIPGYSFVDENTLLTGSSRDLFDAPHVTMVAGEPVIPFYPLGVVIGAAPSPDTYGNNIRSQETYWEDWRETSWSISGGENAWFTHHVYYPLAPGFYWPDGVEVPPIETFRNDDASTLVAYDDDRNPMVPGVGDSVAFLPSNVLFPAVDPLNLVVHLPPPILYKSDWPDVVPTLKAGETLTFQGGEFATDNPITLTVDEDGVVVPEETPGLPGVLAFASAEVVFDSVNPTAGALDESDADNPAATSPSWTTRWTARVGQVLEVHKVDLPFAELPGALAPGENVRVKQGKYVFNSLPASLQKRVRYDPLNGKLELHGLVNDKGIADSTLTASPPAVYVLEPNILTPDERAALRGLASGTNWTAKVNALYSLSRDPKGVTSNATDLQVGLQTTDSKVVPTRAIGPGLAILPNAAFLNPTDASLPTVSYVTVVENNDESLGGLPITPHIIKVDSRERYRGAIKILSSDNVFDENQVLRHTGDFGTKADDLTFEWWYRVDDGSLNVPPPDLIQPGLPNPWLLFPDPSGDQGKGRYEVKLKGNPNAPEALIADTWWFCRYRHKNDTVDGTDWQVTQPDGSDEVNFNWAGAGNSDPFNDRDLNGVPDYVAQLSQGWIKRVLDAVNPYEARIRDFDGDSPSTVASMIQQFGARFEGAVALNPNPNVIQNVGLIELYETILKRGRDLTIDLSRPVASPAIANALQLASTRISDFYTLLGNEAYTDALDPTIGFGSDSVEYGSLAPSVFTFQNQLSSLIEEELSLLRGADYFSAKPIYNRLFWNFTKGEGEAAYALNYNISDINADGFIDEDDAMILFPQGHGDAWGHYLIALRNQYELLKHKAFNWVSRSEFYNLQDIVIQVDFLDERKFAQVAAAKAKAGAEIVDLTYRDKYVEDPHAQWQGYTDSNVDRSWGVQGWARRAGQGAYFDWVTANALLPSAHPNEDLEGIQRVDRQQNDDIAVVSANLNAIQRTFDDANSGNNPLGLAGNVVPFDINPARLDRVAFEGTTHFDQIHDRAVKALQNTSAIWDNANLDRNRLRKIANTEQAFRNSVFQEDLTYRNRLIKIFGRPYEENIGSGKVYPAGYDGPDVFQFQYVDVREITQDTVPGPTASWAGFNTRGNLTTTSEIYKAFQDGLGGTSITTISDEERDLYAPSFAMDADGVTPILVEDGAYNVEYTDLDNPRVDLAGLTDLMPTTAAGYTFQAPDAWGNRLAIGELQVLINQMLQQEAQIARSIAAWDALAGEIGRTLRLANAQLKTGSDIRSRTEALALANLIILNTLKGIDSAVALTKAIKDVTLKFGEAVREGVPKNLPTVGFSVSPGDALSAIRAGIGVSEASTFTGFTATENVLKVIGDIAEISLEIAGNRVDVANADDQSAQNKRELLKGVEDLVGDEAILRVDVFRQIEALRLLSDRYRALADEGARLIDERAAFNKRVAARTQQNRYQDMTFRVSRNHALENYRSSLDLAARYAYLAAKAYDYETNLDPLDAGSPVDALRDIVRARGIGHVAGGQPQFGKGGLAESLAWLKTNFDAQKNQLGITNPQTETGKISLRSELFRIYPAGMSQPTNEVPTIPSPGADSDALWSNVLAQAQVDDLWMLPEFRNYARPFIADDDGSGNHVPQPGIVLRFGSQILAGQNFFGKPLSGGDHAYDPSLYSTKIRSVGVWFSDYQSEDILNDLPEAPRIYLVPAGTDIMRLPNGDDPNEVRYWNLVDQVIPVPHPATSSELDTSNWIPLLDSLDGRLGDPRRFASFRAYHNGSDSVNDDELVYDSRLVGRSVWNTEWLLIIPGLTLNADPAVGLERFIDQVTDIKLVFKTYGYAGQ